jgi:hypothetical protein
LRVVSVGVVYTLTVFCLHVLLPVSTTHTQASDADFCVDVLNGLVAADGPGFTTVVPPPGTTEDKRGLWENGSAAAAGAGSSPRGEDLDETEAHLSHLAALYVQSQHHTLGAGTGTGTGIGATTITRGNAWWSVAAVQRVLLIFALNAKRAWVLRLRARTSLAVYAFIHVVMAAGTSCVRNNALTRSVPAAPADIVLSLPSPPVHTHASAVVGLLHLPADVVLERAHAPRGGPVPSLLPHRYVTSRVTQAILPNVPRTHGLFLCAHCFFCTSAAQFRAAQCAGHRVPTVAVLHECGHRQVGQGSATDADRVKKHPGTGNLPTTLF